MKRILLTAIALCFTVAAAFATDSLIVSRAVFFDVDQYQLTPTVRLQLDSMIGSLRDQGECSVTIFGSTDIDGSARYNQQLSERRAHAVQDYLFAQNIKAVKCVTQGLGRKGDQLSKAENRRVDIQLRFTYFSGVADLFQSLSQNEDQKFLIDPTQPNEIKCRDNSVITIPAGALLLSNCEKPKGKVSLTIREAINTEDILAQDLNSISDGKMLETRGMVYIGAACNGQSLRLDSASPISVAIPSISTDKDMKLFYGEKRDSQSMNWKVADQSFLPNVRIVPIDIDRSMLKGMLLAEGEAPVRPKFTDKISLPLMPIQPRRPIALKEPEKTNAYKGTLIEKAFNKKKIDEINEKQYQLAVDKYQESLEKQQSYRAKMRDYDYAMKVYKQRMKTFEEEGQRRLKEAQSYFMKLYEYSALKSVNALIKSMEQIPITNKTVLTAYSEGRFHQNHVTDQHEVLRQMIGDTYFRFYHFDDPGAEIVDIENTIRKDSISPRFEVHGYTGIFDAVLTSSHLQDTLTMLQERIATRCVELGLFSQKNVSGYVASVSQLGWINCDRFYDTPKEQLVSLKIKETDDVRMYIVFNDIKSCLPVSRRGTDYVSSLIPKGKSVKIVSVKVVEGKPQLAVANVNTSRRDALVLKYKTCSLSDIRSNFAAL